MLGYVAMILILHAAFSTLRWRKYVQASQEDFFLPIDVSPSQPRSSSKLPLLSSSPISPSWPRPRNSNPKNSSSNSRGTLILMQLRQFILKTKFQKCANQPCLPLAALPEVEIGQLVFVVKLATVIVY